jgi:pyruvate-formate lyase-activating enzyme
VLTGFVGPLQEDARSAFFSAVRELAGAPSATVEAFRSVSPRTEGPTRLIVRSERDVLALVLRPADGDAVWRAGPLAVTVERAVDGRAPPASWLRSVAAGLPGSGERLARLHHRWATLEVVEDRHYRHLEQAHNGKTAFLRASFACNQDCHFCWEGRDWPRPPDDLVASWLDELAASGASRVTFCGGEPTLNPRLPDLISRASRVHGLSVHMNTNAIRLRDRDYARRLREAGLSSVLISLHSADPAVSDAMTRAPGTWARTVEGAHAALDAGLTVIVNCVVEQANVAGLGDHARFVRRELVEAHPGNPVRMVNYSQPGVYYDSRLFVGQIVPIDVARASVTEAARILDEAGVLLELTGTCGFPSCIASDIPDRVPWRPAETMDPQHASARVHDPAPCRTCAARSQCIGVRREYVDRFGDRGLQPYAALPTSDWYDRVAKAGLSWG